MIEAVVTAVKSERGFAFAMNSGGETWFLHFSQVLDGDELAVGDRVGFEAGSDHRALGIRVVAPAVEHEGVVKRIVFATHFGFLRGDDGAGYFFHELDCEGGFNELKVGDRVSFVPRPGSKGPRAARVTRHA